MRDLVGYWSKIIVMKEISVVIPVYGCKEALPELHKRLTNTLTNLVKDYEIVLVDDNCPQNSWEEIRRICEEDKNVVGIHLSRNFGQTKAITAGLDFAEGEWVVVMDCDLQDRPEGIVDLYNKAKEGYDIVFAQRENRQDKALTKFFSRTYYRVYDHYTDQKSDYSVSNFSIANKKVIEKYKLLKEEKRDYTILLRWLGFKHTSIPVEADSRFAGESSYTFKKKINLAIDFITSQSTKPLYFSIKLGFVMSILSFLYIIYLVISYFVLGDVNPGWTSTIASIFLVGGLLLSALGVTGIYIGNIFEETKDRPLYIVSEIINKKEK